tara:strand:+ start:7244 stop:7543 length:300 start_codon:yes stop_codon:yes gene_type:complete
MGKTNKYLDLWRKLVMEHRRKHGGTLKEAMQNKSVKAEYARRKKSLGGSSKASPRKASPRKASPRKASPRKASPRKMTSPRRRKPSPTKRKRKARKAKK